MSIFVPPRDEVEALLVRLCEEELGIAPIGVHDHFFELGGSSLGATRVLARLREVVELDVPLEDWFEELTVAGLAARLERAQEAEPLPLRLPDRDGELSAQQARTWVMARRADHADAFALSVRLRLRGRLDLAVLRRAVREIATRHDSLRSRFPAVDGVPRCVVEPEPRDHFDCFDARRSSDRRHVVAAHLRDASRLRFDLEAGPLWAAGVVRVADDEHVLWLTVHHIVADGTSLVIWARELRALYEAYLRGRPSPLAPAPQYRSYASWQNARRRSGGFDRQLRHWTSRLGELPPPPPLPIARASTSARGCESPSHALALGPELCRLLEEAARGARATFAAVLLAAFAVLLCRVSGKRAVVMGSPSANRTHRAFEGIIGFVANAQLLQVELPERPTWSEAVAIAQATLSEAQMHQEVPFADVLLHLGYEWGGAVPYRVIFNGLAPFEPFRMADVAVDLYGELDLASGCDLLLAWAKYGDGARLAFAYRAGLFSHDAVAELRDRYLDLLHRVATKGLDEAIDLRDAAGCAARAGDS